jgi:predicted DCC family thiol-disulfide oxidoreductase YuxK
MTITETPIKDQQLDSLLAESSMLYDGKCVFCNGATKFALEHEQQPLLKFAPLQSEPGRLLCEHFGLPTEEFRTFVIVTDGKAYTRYQAAIQLGYLMGGRWATLAKVLDTLVPDFIGNPIYSILWPMRKIFGAKEQCIIPTPDQKLRQLDGAEMTTA